ncbi:MAG: hypothetical protein RIS43_986 [Actinomycetota bacterium]|jgi:hypothetical protein
MNESASTLLPCSGLRLAAAISRHAELDYRSAKAVLQDQAEAEVAKALGFSMSFLSEISQFQRRQNWSSNRMHNEVASLQSSVRFIANSLLTPGRTGFDRTQQKVWQFIKDAHQVEFMLREADQSHLASVLAEAIHKFESTDAPEAFANGLYLHLEELRREKTGLSTNVSRVRRISEWLLEQENAQFKSLGDRTLTNYSEAEKWLEEVFFAFISDNEKLEKFGASYRRAWDLEGRNTLEGVSSDNDKVLENLAYMRKPTSSLKRHQMNLLSFEESMDMPLMREQRSQSGSRADFTSPAQVELDLKAGGRGLEARYTLPAHVQPRTQELQIKLMTFVGKEFPTEEVSITATTSPRAIITVAATSSNSERFGKVAFAVLQMLNKECS